MNKQQTRVVAIILLVMVAMSLLYVVPFMFLRPEPGKSDVQLIQELFALPSDEEVVQEGFVDRLFTTDDHSRTNILYVLRMKPRLLNLHIAQRLIAWIESDFYNDQDDLQVQTIFRRAPDVIEQAIMKRFAEPRSSEILLNRVRTMLPLLDPQYSKVLDDSVPSDQQVVDILKVYQSRLTQ